MNYIQKRYFKNRRIICEITNDVTYETLDAMQCKFSVARLFSANIAACSSSNRLSQILRYAVSFEPSSFHKVTASDCIMLLTGAIVILEFYQYHFLNKEF